MSSIFLIAWLVSFLAALWWDSGVDIEPDEAHDAQNQAITDPPAIPPAPAHRR
jgi:hypothetical protein